MWCLDFVEETSRRFGVKEVGGIASSNRDDRLACGGSRLKTVQLTRPEGSLQARGGDGNSLPKIPPAYNAILSGCNYQVEVRSPYN